MSGKSPSSSPQLSSGIRSGAPSSQAFASVHDVIGETPAPGLATAAKLSLDALKDILEAVDTLPCVKYIAGVGIKILDLTDELQTNKEAVRAISIRAGDIVLAVARACEGAREDMAAALESDLQQLTGTMNDILAFTSDMAARPGYKRLLYKMEDAGAIKALDTQLTHAFQVFEIQSSVSLRISQQKMTQKLATAPTVGGSALVTTAPLRVPEGVYIIRCAVEGRVLEAEHVRLRTRRRNAHIYVVPFRDNISPYQLWFVFKREGKELEYTIRNFATGVVLDVFCGHTKPGTQVIGHSAYGYAIQQWGFYATRSVAGYDYCTIRSYGTPTVMDAKCARGGNCELLHMGRLRSDGPYPSQEWSLMRMPRNATASRPSSIPHAPHPVPEDLPRREYWLQNVASGAYASARGLDDMMDDANIVLDADQASASPWHFVYTTKDPRSDEYEEQFAIVTGTAPRLATLDHYAQRQVLASAERFWPSDHQHMWKAIPRAGGTFAFRNAGSRRLLCQSRVTGVADTAPPTACDNPACLWRLVDPHTGKLCKVLYDATVSIVPPELESGAADADVQALTAPPRLRLRIQDTSPEVAERFHESLKAEHDLVRGMLEAGYSSIVLGPQAVMGCKDGILAKTFLQDENAMFGMPNYKGQSGWDACPT